MAGCGAQLKQGKDRGRRPRRTSTALFKNVPVQDDSARKALQTFTGGKGDVLLAYENEAIFAQQKGEAIDYIVPDQTILIENPVAVTSRSEAPRAGQGVPRLPAHARRRRRSSSRTATARSIEGVGADKFPTPQDAVHHRRPRRLGRRDKKFFDPTTGIMADVERGHRSLG